MKLLKILTKRNIKLFFKDKGLFLTSLITPMILLVLYVSFLANVYRDSYAAGLPEGVISEKLRDALVSGQLVSSLLAVSTVTVSFCSNMLMVQDKVKGQIKDFSITPVNSSTLAFSYFLSTVTVTLIISLSAFLVGSVYIMSVGWFLTVSDVLHILLDIILLVLFGTALSSIINVFLSSQGQISAVGTIVSSGYGFLCGAYMPISQFSEGLQNAIAFLPGTYGTSLFRQHFLFSVLNEIEAEGVPEVVINELRDITDCNIYFFDSNVSEYNKYLILIGAVAVLLGIYILLHRIVTKHK